MKDHWWCIVVFWKAGEIQSIWVKSESLAQEILSAIMEKDEWDKIKMFQEREKDEQG